MGLIISNNIRESLKQQKPTGKYFRIPTDEDLARGPLVEDNNNMTLEEIKAYVESHTSGEKKHYDLAEGGVMTVTFQEFVDMVNNGYNIISAEVLNNDCISIRYQKEIKKDKRGR